jgi:hypothetical protein
VIKFDGALSFAIESSRAGTTTDPPERARMVMETEKIGETHRRNLVIAKLVHPSKKKKKKKNKKTAPAEMQSAYRG